MTRNAHWVEFVAVAVVLLVGVALMGMCGTKPDTTRRVLEAQGFTRVEPGGYAWLDCSEKDVFRTRFTAQSPAGVQVTGAVCSGWFKNNTVRFD